MRPQSKERRKSVSENWQPQKWYVLFVRSNQERRVADALAARSVEHYLPSYSAIRQWKDRRVKLEMPLFPGYVFVHLALIEKMKALTVPNVVSLVGSSRVASEVPEEEVLGIRRGLEQGNVRPHPYLNEGERVIITSGIMSGMRGILLRRHGETQVVVSVESIFRSFVVEVDTDCVKPIIDQNALGSEAYDPAPWAGKCSPKTLFPSSVCPRSFH
jgi:transcription antitermination factor NusG